MEYINLKDRKDVLRLGFKDKDGNIIKNDKGDEIYIEFNLGDVDLPLNYHKCLNQIEEAKRKLKTQYIIINKKQDHKGKGLLSKNEIAKVNALKQFYKEMEIAMDLFLGQGGTKKFLNGKKPYLEMWDDISEAIEPYMDRMQLTVKDMESRIKEKYKVTESDVLTND